MRSVQKKNRRSSKKDCCKGHVCIFLSDSLFDRWEQRKGRRRSAPEWKDRRRKRGKKPVSAAAADHRESGSADRRRWSFPIDRCRTPAGLRRKGTESVSLGKAGGRCLSVPWLQTGHQRKSDNRRSAGWC